MEISSTPPPLWKLVFCCDNPDDRAHELLPLGTQGVALEGGDTVSCYVEGSRQETDAFCLSAEALGFKLLLCTPQPPRNWVEDCKELWQPVQIGEITITPVCADEQARRAADQEILILPGAAFGTGHHPSTRMCLQLLQHSRLIRQPPSRALDVGSGSAILAIAAARLYDCAAVGCDTDPSVMDNARANIRINLLEDRVGLFVGTLNAALPAFDLLLANIYAEALCDLEPQFCEALPADGHLIVAGILEEQRGAVAEHFGAPRWNAICALSYEGWRAMLLKKLEA